MPSKLSDGRTAVGPSRRAFMLAGAGGILALRRGLFAAAATLPATPRSRLGLVSYVLGIRQKAQSAQGEKKGLSDPLAFLEECRRMGAGGMQVALGERDGNYLAKLRRMGEEHALHIEAVIELPEDRAGLDRLEKQILSAREAGAQVARTVVMPGRRYEQFGSAEEFARAAQRALESLQRAEPIARRHRFRLAVENHKDQRVPERLELLKRLGSEHIGMCVDVGNSFALCEDPMEVVRAYAPWAFTVHLKDQAVGEYEDGFLLADAALGKGFLDLAAMVRVLREARPEVRFNLEVITRDPLRIPVLTPKYWATMAGVPAADLARTMRTVKANTSRDGLAAVSSLSVEAQIECETRNVEASLAYARDHLRL